MLFVAVITIQLLLVVSSHVAIRDQIPNGHKVFHPCGNDAMKWWEGVGWTKMNGHGILDPFGRDFVAVGGKWTKELCEKDSDGDGKTNGEELDDPTCSKVGNGAGYGAYGHPGICEPIGIPKCIRKNYDAGFRVCEGVPGVKALPLPEGECDGRNMTVDKSIKEIELRFNPTDIPATETNYYCKIFDLPSDGDYHISADEPIIDNEVMVHHMLLYACPPSVDVSALVSKFGDKAASCGMMIQEKCSHIISGWSKGVTGDCYDGLEAGTRIGGSPAAFKKAVLEVHWNNPKKLANQKDSSGIKMFYSSKMKPYDLGVLTVGQAGIRIPPGKPAFEETATCSSTCTAKKLGKEKRMIVSAGMHMHFIGSSGLVALWRNNNLVKVLDNPKTFNYNRPESTNHFPAVEMMPGDELRVSCIYDSMKQSKYVYYGPATSDEMCYTYISYYPKVNDFTLCLVYGNTGDCNNNDLQSVGGCDVRASALKQKFGALGNKCDLTGAQCKTTCKAFLTSDACFKADGDARRYIEYTLRNDADGPKYIAGLRSCDGK